MRELKGDQPRLELIQCFRGVAAILVLMFHVAVVIRERAGYDFFWHYLRPGSTGVDFFFVLSGFIIFRVHGKDIGFRQRLRGYAWRRFVRVYPLYAILTLALVPLYFAGFGKAGKLTLNVLLSSLTLMPLPPGQLPIIGQGWTLTHEALFYLIFGLFIVLGRRCAIGLSSVVLAGSLAELFLGLTGLSLPGPYWISHWLFSPFNLEFACGCLAALVVTRVRCDRISWLLPAGVILLAAVWTIPSQNPNEILAPDDRLVSKMVLLFAIPYMCITAGAVAWESSRRLRIPPVLLAIGDATYSVYLTHFVIVSASIAAVLRFLHPQARVLNILLIGCAYIAVALGCLLHGWLEKPMLDRLRSQRVARRAMPQIATEREVVTRQLTSRTVAFQGK